LHHLRRFVEETATEHILPRGPQETVPSTNSRSCFACPGRSLLDGRCQSRWPEKLRKQRGAELVRAHSGRATQGPRCPGGAVPKT
jgi:hypothetical protein